MSTQEHLVENAIFSWYTYKFADNSLELWREEELKRYDFMSEEELKELEKELDMAEVAGAYVFCDLCDFNKDRYLDLIWYRM